MPRHEIDPVYGPRLREILAGEPLNEREVETLIWAARGKTAAATGAEVFLSGETIKSYRKRACAKLSADSTTHAVVLALAAGLFSIEEVVGDGHRA